jgi:hypothetical protein
MEQLLEVCKKGATNSSWCAVVAPINMICLILCHRAQPKYLTWQLISHRDGRDTSLDGHTIATINRRLHPILIRFHRGHISFSAILTN